MGAAISKLADRVKEQRLIGGMSLFNDDSRGNPAGQAVGKILFRDQTVVEEVAFEDLYYISAEGSYSKVVYRSGNQDHSIVVSRPIAAYDELLPVELFCRVHKSHLVNCKHVSRIDKRNCTIVLADKYTLPVSRRRFAYVVDSIKLAIGKYG